MRLFLDYVTSFAAGNFRQRRTIIEKPKQVTAADKKKQGDDKRTNTSLRNASIDRKCNF